MGDGPGSPLWDRFPRRCIRWGAAIAGICKPGDGPLSGASVDKQAFLAFFWHGEPGHQNHLQVFDADDLFHSLFQGHFPGAHYNLFPIF